VSRLAFFTFGMLHEPLDHPQNASFHEAVGDVFAHAGQAEGFLWGAEVTQDYVWPSFAGDQGTKIAQTLTLWRDLDCVRHFAYQGPHAGALRRRRDWFTGGSWPTFVAWWVPDDTYPTWPEAARRLEHLNDHGPTPEGFTFNAAFDQTGRAIPRRR
jgi:hypothetical protein